MLVDQIRTLVDRAASFEAWTLSGAEVREAVTEVQRARTALDALLSGLAGAADGMGLPKEDGGTSTTVWLANRTGIVKGEASNLVAMSKVTTEYTEATRQAWAIGELSTAKASVIMRAIHDLPDWVDDEPRHDAETHLLKLAADYNVDDLKRLANRVLEVVDPDGADEQNAIHLGMEPDDYKALAREQKMGHAFIELINHLPTEALPKAGGFAATVAVTVDIDDLRTGQGYATTSSGTDVSAQRARRMACNAHLVALYLDGANRVIDHGMARRLYDRHQRLALAVRDKGCVWAGCDRPPAWCEAHHLDFWSENGPTDLNNAALVCHFHHTLLHEGQWQARMAPDDIIEVIPPPHVDPHQRPRRHARFTRQQPRPG